MGAVFPRACAVVHSPLHPWHHCLDRDRVPHWTHTQVSRIFSAFHDLDATQLHTKVLLMASQGYRATWISGYGTASALFAAVFVKAPEAWALWVDMDSASYQV